MSILRRLRAAAISALMTVSIAGCMTIRPSKIPYFIERLEEHSFSGDQKETIGEILRYVNELENQ